MKTVVNQWISYILCFDSKTNFRMKINAFFLWQNLWHALIYVCVCAICDAMGYCNSTVCVCACVCTLSMRVLMVGVLHDCRNFLGIYTWDWIVALLVIGACEGICFIFICAVLMWRIRVGTSYFLSGLVHFLGGSTSYAVWEPFPISPENPVGNTIGFWEQNENECCKGMMVEAKGLEQKKRCIYICMMTN